MITNKTVISILFLFFFASCTTTKKVVFSNPVDTTTKPIAKQIKKTYSLTDVDIYASNEFDGARLNGFEKLNDSTALVIIHPENVPINNSAYYAFIYGLITLSVLLINLLIFPLVFTKFFNPDKWTIYKMLLYVLEIILTISFANWYFSKWVNL